MSSASPRGKSPTSSRKKTALSALRAGARVQVTLWSGLGQITSTRGFVRDEPAILRVLTGFYGGATTFPLHVLRDTFATRPRHARPCHVLVISDDGVTTMFQPDEKKRPGREVAREALERARGGGTMVLQARGRADRLPRTSPSPARTAGRSTWCAIWSGAGGLRARRFSDEHYAPAGNP